MIVLEVFIAMVIGLLLHHTEPAKEDAPEKVENTEPAGTIYEETAEVVAEEQVEKDRKGHEEVAAKAAKKFKKKIKKVVEEVDVDRDMFSDKYA